MKLPEKVKVGCYDVRIVPMHGMEGFAHGCLGHFSSAEMVIRISIDLPEIQVINTLLHEVLHSCYYVAGLEDTDEEERIITCLANQYLQVIIDNPAYNKAINSCSKKEK